MMEHFFTWGDLATYGGAVMAVLIITEFTKDLPFIRRIPTRLWAYCVALVLLLTAVVFTSDIIYAEDVLLFFINGVIVAMAAVGSYHAVQERTE